MSVFSPMRAMLAAVVLLSSLPVHASEVEEYRAKAVYLYNFLKFVEWPEAKGSSGPLQICVLGKSPITQVLNQTFSKESVDSRPIRVLEVKDSNAASSCHIVFASEDGIRQSRSLIRQLAGAPVLTVGESDGFAGRDGIVGLQLKGGRISIQICKQSAQNSKLRISSKLMQLADIVGPSGGEK